MASSTAFAPTSSRRCSALVTLRPAPEARLYLQRAEYGRAPGWDASTDYNVLFRGRPIGRIWRFIYDKERHQDFPWHWRLMPPNEGREDWGHAMTLIEAMEHFRRAWDAFIAKDGLKKYR